MGGHTWRGSAKGEGRSTGRDPEAHVLSADERRDLMLRFGNDALLLFDAGYRVIDCNERALEIFGYERDELLGLGIDAVRAEQPQVPLELRKEALRRSDRSVFESVGRRRDGSTFPIETSLHVVRTEHGPLYHATIRDITERREAQLRLHLSLAAANAGTWEWDLTTDENTWSREVWGLYDLDPAAHEASYASWLESVRPEDRADLEAMLAETVAWRAELDFDWRVNTRDGSERWLHSHGRPEVDDNGALVRYRGVIMDVTERHRAEAMAQVEHAKLDAALKSMTDAVYIFDAQGELIDFNDAFVTVNRFTSRDDCLTALHEYPGITEVLRPDGTLAPLEEWPSSRALRGEVGVDEEFTVRRTDTGETWVGSYSFSPLRSQAGEVTGAVLVARDISERKRTEDELRRSEALLARSQQIAHLGSWELDVRTGRLGWSDEAYRIVGCEPREFAATYETFLDFVHPDDRAAVDESYTRSLREGRDGYEIDHRIVSKATGEVRVVHERCVHERDEEGAVVRSIGMVHDITERKLTEEALRQSEAEKQTALDAAELGVWWNDLRTGVVRFDERGREHYGFSFGETTLDEVLARVHPDDADRLAGEIAAATHPVTGSGAFATEYRVTPPDLPMRWLSVVVRVRFEGDGDDRRASVGFGTTADVTARKRLERSLRESEAEARETVERLSRAHRLGHIGDWEWDVATGLVRWSDEVYRIYGVDQDFSTTVDTIVPMVHPDDRARHLARAQEILDDPDRASGSLQFRVVRPDGSVRHILQTLAIERDDEGKALRVFGLQQDVTELRETEEALIESEYRLRRIYDAGLVGVVYWTAEGGISDANDRFLEMLGYTRAELEAGELGWAAITPPEWAARDRQSLEELRATGRNAVPFAKEYYRKDGSRLPILTAAAAFDDEGTEGIALIVDISEQTRAEEELRRLNLELEERVRRRTSDLESANAELESFSYSVSHDLRAPLRHISGYSTLLREELGDGGAEARHFLRRIEQASLDMSVLIDDLLQFSRVGRAVMHVERVDMVALVNDVLEVLRGEAGDRSVEVTVGELPPAMGDRTLLRQVWANLLGNAFKYTRPRDPAVIEVGWREDGPETAYWVRDNGVGFDMRYVDRLFRVFERLHRAEEFEGTGIGLANVGRIVGRHGGRYGAEAVQNEGATFWFSLPRAG